MEPLRYISTIMCVVAMLLGGCRKHEESAKATQKTDAYSVVRLSGSVDEVAGSKALSHTDHRATYRRPEYGYEFCYDSSQMMIVPRGGGSLEFRHGPTRVARLFVINILELYPNVKTDSVWGETFLRRTGMLPDKILASAMHRTTDVCAADGDDGSSYLEMPPTRVLRDTTAHGIPFSRVWCDYVYRSFGHPPPPRRNVGPIYLVDMSALGKPMYLGIIHHCEKIAPPDIETFLDTLVNSLEIVR